MRHRAKQKQQTGDPALRQAHRAAVSEAKALGMSQKKIEALEALATERVLEANLSARSDETKMTTEERRPFEYEYHGPNPRFRMDSKGEMLRDLLQSGLLRFGYPRPSGREVHESGHLPPHRYQQQQVWQAGHRLGYPGLWAPYPGAKSPPNPRDELLRELFVVGVERFGMSSKRQEAAVAGGADGRADTRGPTLADLDATHHEL